MLYLSYLWILGVHVWRVGDTWVAAMPINQKYRPIIYFLLFADNLRENVKLRIFLILGKVNIEYTKNFVAIEDIQLKIRFKSHWFERNENHFGAQIFCFIINAFPKATYLLNELRVNSYFMNPMAQWALARRKTHISDFTISQE